jgi:hypothetical protein
MYNDMFSRLHLFVISFRESIDVVDTYLTPVLSVHALTLR